MHLANMHQVGGLIPVNEPKGCHPVPPVPLGPKTAVDYGPDISGL